MDDVDLGRAASDSPGTASASDDERHDSSDDQPQPQSGPLSQRLRGSLSNLRQSLVHADAKTNGGRLRNAMQRMRRKDNHDESDADDERELGRRSLSQQLHAALSASGLQIVHHERLVLLGSSPLVQPQDDELFLERSSSSTGSPTLQRGDYIRVQSPDDATQSWLCQVAVDRLHSDVDVIPLVLPFPGPLVPDAVVHYVPRECLPTELTEDDDDDEYVESEQVSELRSSVDAWRPSVDDPADSTDDDDAMERDPRFSEVAGNSRASVAREKAAALYENFKSKKARLRTSSADYKEKIKQVGMEKLAAASQVSKQKLAVASQVSKEKLAVASQASKEKLAAASVVSKEKLAVASQASKEKLVVAGQASKLKMQSWTSSARSSLKAKMAQRAESKATAAGAAAALDSGEGVTAAAGAAAAESVFTIEDAEDQPLMATVGEEEQLRREIAEV